MNNKINIKIAGAGAKYNFLLKYFLKNRTYLKDYNICLYDMFNSCQWNGGRLNSDIILTDSMIKSFKNNNISLSLGFSNNILNDYSDIIGNNLIKKSKDILSSIIVSDEQFNKYLKDTYNVKTTFSITGHPLTKYLNYKEYYKDLESKYDYIVPKYGHLPYIIELLKSKDLNPEKYEILVNDNCTEYCIFNKKHWITAGMLNIINSQYNIPIDDLCKKLNYNPDGDNCPAIKVENYKLIELYNLGIRNFKISGRDQENDFFESELDLSFALLNSLQ